MYKRIFLLLLTTIFWVAISGASARPEIGWSTASAQADGEQNIDTPLVLTEHIGGATWAMAVNGDYLYMGIGPKLAIIDVSEPDNPQQISSAFLSGIPTDIVIDGGTAYVTTDSSLRVIDVSEPATPLEIGFYEPSDMHSHFFEDIDIWENYAFVVDEPYLRIIDISNQQNPTEVSKYEYLNHDEWASPSVAVRDNYAFFGVSDGLVVLDVTEPTQPTVVSLVDSLPEVTDSIENIEEIIVVGQRAILRSYNYLHILDITDLANPVKIGGIHPADAKYLYEWSTMEVVDNTLYVANGEALNVMDISDPNQLSVISTFDFGCDNGTGRSPRIEIEQNRLYVMDPPCQGSSTIVILDISDSSNLDKIGSFETVQRVNSLEDIAELNNPDIADIIFPQSPLRESDYVVANGYEYLTERWYEYDLWYDESLKVVDISDINNPVVCTTFEVPLIDADYAAESLGAMAIVANYVYIDIPYRGNGISIVDMLQPNNPIAVNHILQGSTYGTIDSMELRGRHVYVHSDTGLTVLDVSQPASPVGVAFYDWPHRNYHGFFGSTLYLSELDKLFLIDTSDPANLVEMGVFTGLPVLQDWPDKLDTRVEHPYVYVAARRYGLYVYQIGDQNEEQPASFTFLPMVSSSSFANRLSSDNAMQGAVFASHFDEFENTTCFRDSSTFHNHSTCAGDTCPASSVEGAVNYALQFDGKDDFLRIGNSDSLDNIREEISLSAWINIERTDGIRNIIAHGYAQQPDGEVYLRISNGIYEVGAWNGTPHKAIFPIPDEDIGTWIHLTGTYDGEAWRLYRNGLEVNATQATVGSIAVNDQWAIGSNGRGDERFFQGRIDEVGIYKRALTSAEVQVNYTANSTEANSEATCQTFDDISEAECEALVAIYQANSSTFLGEWVITQSPCRQKWVTCFNKQVTELDLSETGLTTLPPEVGNFLALRILRLQGNPLSSLPAEIGTLVELKELRVDSGQLTTLPPAIGNLASLESLNVYGNKLATFPPEIGNLANLQDLQASNNEITSLPPEIGNLASLHTLRLSENPLTAFPKQISYLASLEILDVPRNDYLQLFIIDTIVNGSGHIEQTPPGKFHVNGATIQLRAVPDSGHSFVRWESDQEGELGEQATQPIVTYTINIPNGSNWGSVSYDAYFD